MSESKDSDRSQAKPAGCVVILEPGAKWPEKVFASIPDREGVAVVNESTGEAPEHFFKRLARQCALLTSSGVLIRTVLIVCAATTAICPIERSHLVQHVHNHMLCATSGVVMFVMQGEEPVLVPAHEAFNRVQPAHERA